MQKQIDPENWRQDSFGDEYGTIRLATNGKRIRIRCSNMQFDPPIEMDVNTFSSIIKIGKRLIDGE